MSRTGRVVGRLGNPNIKDLTGTGAVTLKANADAFAERVLPMIADAQRRGHTCHRGRARAVAGEDSAR